MMSSGPFAVGGRVRSRFGFTGRSDAGRLGSVWRPVITGVVFNNSPVDGDTYRANEEISVGPAF